MTKLISSLESALRVPTSATRLPARLSQLRRLGSVHASQLESEISRLQMELEAAKQHRLATRQKLEAANHGACARCPTV